MFKGAVAQQFDSNDQIIGNVVIDCRNRVVIAGHSVHQTGGTFTTTIQLRLPRRVHEWRDPRLGGRQRSGHRGDGGTLPWHRRPLSFGTGRDPRCGSCAASPSRPEPPIPIINTNPNTVTASGSVNIGGGFTPANSINSTLVMTGAPTTLAATPQIGNLTISGSVTLGSAISMAGNMDISATTASLDVSPCELSNHPRRQLGRQHQNRRRAQLRGRDRQVHGGKRFDLRETIPGSSSTMKSPEDSSTSRSRARRLSWRPAFSRYPAFRRR